MVLVIFVFSRKKNVPSLHENLAAGDKARHSSTGRTLCRDRKWWLCITSTRSSSPTPTPSLSALLNHSECIIEAVLCLTWPSEQILKQGASKTLCVSCTCWEVNEGAPDSWGQLVHSWSLFTPLHHLNYWRRRRGTQRADCAFIQVVFSHNVLHGCLLPGWLEASRDLPCRPPELRTENISSSVLIRNLFLSVVTQSK